VIANVCCFVIVFLVYYAQATAPEIVGILGLDAFHVNKKEQIRVPWRNSNLAPIVHPPPSAFCSADARTLCTTYNKLLRTAAGCLVKKEVMMI
jgi:hypothetical protein